MLPMYFLHETAVMLHACYNFPRTQKVLTTLEYQLDTTHHRSPFHPLYQCIRNGHHLPPKLLQLCMCFRRWSQPKQKHSFISFPFQLFFPTQVKNVQLQKNFSTVFFARLLATMKGPTPIFPCSSRLIQEKSAERSVAASESAVPNCVSVGVLSSICE